jgi:membrane protein YqaA with SNARE-associated domain
MNVPTFDIKGILAILVIIGDFLLIGVYVIRNETPDGVIIAIVSSSIGAILGFYFGHANGSMTALSAATVSLANRTNPGSTVSEAGPDVLTPS